MILKEALVYFAPADRIRGILRAGADLVSSEPHIL